MEPIRPGAALEREVNFAAGRGLLALAAMVAMTTLEPLSAQAHLADFILAKVTPQEGSVALDLTIDGSGESMIGSEAEARAVLEKVLRVQVDGKSRELGALAALQFERRTQIDPAAPVPRDPGDETRPHRLLGATWVWKCGGKQVRFEVPQGITGGQSVILWTPAEKAGQAPRWVILMGGDVSPEFAIARAPVNPWVFAGVGVGLVGICIPVVSRWRRKRWVG